MFKDFFPGYENKIFNFKQENTAKKIHYPRNNHLSQYVVLYNDVRQYVGG